jgi:hypothetical protein
MLPDMRRFLHALNDQQYIPCGIAYVIVSIAEHARDGKRQEMLWGSTTKRSTQKEASRK